MTKSRPAFAIIALTALVSQVSLAQSLPPIRQLGPVTAVAKEPLGAVSTVRHLPDGRVLVNDIIGRRVVMFDSSLSTSTLIADTTSATASAYGVRPGGLIPYRGDSTLFIDPASLSMLLIDPNGKIARVMSAPRAGDVGFLVGGPFGNPGFDPQGRLVYRAPPQFRFAGPRPPGNGPPSMPAIPDSAAIVRFDLATRKLDTATWFKTPKVTMNIVRTGEGQVRANSTLNPLPQGDDWAILSDGTIALVRTKDYHIDWLSPQGALTSSPKIPFQWERLSDEAKVALVDSARTAIQRARESGQFLIASGAPGGPPRGGEEGAERARRRGDSSATPAPQPGTITVATGEVTTVASAGPGAGGGQLPQITMVSPSELPDYRPAFTPGSTRADPDGNLWIRTSQHVDGIPVYNVVNRKGELIDRVQLPKNRVLVGFGPAGIVYMAVRDGRTAHLEKARVK